ncbi:MAG: molybdopterin-binding protein, partial [Candidatus Binatia bacterium]
MQITGRKALVLGAGRSGVASSKFLAGHGAVVALHDRKEIEAWSADARALKDTHNVGLMSGDIPSWLLDQIDLVVISPGVPTNSIPARYVDRKDGEVIGEIELAYRFLKGRIVGITGSNGKTTTTTLIGELLKKWSARHDIDAIITTGGTGLTGRDVTVEAMRPLFEKEIDGFSALFHQISYEKVGTSTIQSRACAGVVGGTFLFALPGSTGAVKDAWDGILKYQLDSRHRPCNFVEIMPRLEEHLAPAERKKT